MVPEKVDLLGVSANYLDNMDLIAEVQTVCKVKLVHSFTIGFAA